MKLEKTWQLLIGKLQGWFNDLVLILPNFVAALLVMGVFVVAAKLLRRGFLRLFGRISERSALVGLGGTLVNVGVLCVGVVVSLEILHLEKTVMSVLAGVGVIGLALGFAFQDIAANFMSGVLILVRRPLRVGHLVKTGDYFGHVQAINLRNTIIVTLSGETVLIPNKSVFQSPLVNYSLTDERRVDVVVGVSYDEDLVEAQARAREAVEAIEARDGAREVEVFYSAFGGSSIDFQLRFWIDSPEESAYLAARSDAIIAIKRAFDAADITIPFPIRTLDFGADATAALAQLSPRSGSSRAGSDGAGVTHVS
ncbi:MAG: mechanosensitive ion channel family protein [Myxococcales bacterium]|nr:mechanosensitive ion channel family protein [Myxococcales bacterium]